MFICLIIEEGRTMGRVPDFAIAWGVREIDTVETEWGPVPRKRFLYQYRPNAKEE